MDRNGSEKGYKKKDLSTRTEKYTQQNWMKLKDRKTERWSIATRVKRKKRGETRSGDGNYFNHLQLMRMYLSLIGSKEEATQN